MYNISETLEFITSVKYAVRVDMRAKWVDQPLVKFFNGV